MCTIYIYKCISNYYYYHQEYLYCIPLFNHTSLYNRYNTLFKIRYQFYKVLHLNILCNHCIFVCLFGSNRRMSYSDFLEKSCVCPCFSHIIFSTAAPSTKIALRKFILQLLKYIFKSKILPGSEQAIQRQAISWYFIAQSYICPFRSNVSIIFSGLTLQKLHWIADFEIFVVVVWVFLKHDI